MATVTPNEQDLVKGYDHTANDAVTASTANQVVDAATPYSDRGLIITTTDVLGVIQEPDPTAYSDKFKRYIWKRIITNSLGTVIGFRLYVYDATSSSWEDILKDAKNGLDNVAVLRALPTSLLAEGDTYRVNSHTTTGDRGGGTFRWDADATEEDDNGGWLLPDDTSPANPGRWYRVIEHYVTPFMFGAKADGVTNDLLAIQRALDFAANWGRHVTVWFPFANPPAAGATLSSPHYGVEGQINLPANIRLEGDGRASIICQKSDAHTFVTVNGVKALNGNIIYSGGALYTGSAASENLLDYDHQLSISKLWLTRAYTDQNTTGKAHLVCSRPGEAFNISECQFWRQSYGVMVIGGGTPGFSANNLSTHYNSKAGLYWKDYDWAGGAPPAASGVFTKPIARGNLNNFVFDTQTADADLTAPPCAILFDKVFPRLTCDRLKLENKMLEGAVRVILPDRNTADPSPTSSDLSSLYDRMGYVDIRGIDAVGSCTTAELATACLVKIEGLTTGDTGGVMVRLQCNATTTQSYRWAIIDEHCPNADGNAHKYPVERPATSWGAAQNTFNTPITYCAKRIGTTVYRSVEKSFSMHQLIEFDSTDTDQVGWYKIASGVTSISGIFTVGGKQSTCRFQVNGMQRSLPSIRVLEHASGGEDSNGSTLVKAIMVQHNGPTTKHFDVLVYLDITETNKEALRYSKNQVGSSEQVFMDIIGVHYDAPFKNEPYPVLTAPVQVSTITPGSFDVILPVEEYSSDQRSPLIYNRDHLIYGDKHIWEDSNRKLRVKDSYVNVVIADTAGSGANLKAVVRDGAVASVIIINGGSGYTSAARGYVTGKYGSGAVLNAPTVSGGVITALTVNTGGSGYRLNPINDLEGDAVLLENFSYGQRETATRVFYTGQTIDVLMTTNSKYGLRPVAGTSFLTDFRIGDVMMDSDGALLRVVAVHSSDLIEFDTAHAVAGHDKFSIPLKLVGFRLLTNQAGKQLIPTSFECNSLGVTAWAGADAISFRFLDGTQIAYCSSLTGSSTVPRTVALVQGVFGSPYPDSVEALSVAIGTGNVTYPTGGSGVCVIAEGGLR